MTRMSQPAPGIQFLMHISSWKQMYLNRLICTSPSRDEPWFNGAWNYFHVSSSIGRYFSPARRVHCLCLQPDLKELPGVETKRPGMIHLFYNILFKLPGFLFVCLGFGFPFVAQIMNANDLWNFLRVIICQEVISINEPSR